MTDHNIDLYKTEMCNSWIVSGSCRYKDKCRFAHGEHELREKLIHEKFKTKMCESILNKVPCKYRQRCRFAHGEHELRAFSISTQANHPILNTITSTPVLIQRSEQNSLTPTPTLSTPVPRTQRKNNENHVHTKPVQQVSSKLGSTDTVVHVIERYDESIKMGGYSIEWKFPCITYGQQVPASEKTKFWKGMLQWNNA